MLLTKEKLFFNYWTPYRNQSKIYIYSIKYNDTGKRIFESKKVLECQ